MPHRLQLSQDRPNAMYIGYLDQRSGSAVLNGTKYGELVAIISHRSAPVEIFCQAAYCGCLMASKGVAIFVSDEEWAAKMSEDSVQSSETIQCTVHLAGRGMQRSNL